MWQLRLNAIDRLHNVGAWLTLQNKQHGREAVKHSEVAYILNGVLYLGYIRQTYRGAVAWSNFQLATYLLGLVLSATSIRRRIASGRVVEKSCSAIHESRLARSDGCKRTNTGKPFPVGGGPRLFRDIMD